MKYFVIFIFVKLLLLFHIKYSIKIIFVTWSLIVLRVIILVVVSHWWFCLLILFLFMVWSFHIFSCFLKWCRFFSCRRFGNEETVLRIMSVAWICCVSEVNLILNCVIDCIWSEILTTWCWRASLRFFTSWSCSSDIWIGCITPTITEDNMLWWAFTNNFASRANVLIGHGLQGIICLICSLLNLFDR